MITQQKKQMITQSKVTKLTVDIKEINISIALEKDEETTEYTIFQKKLGEGAFGSVFLAKNCKTNQECAVKIVSKKDIDNVNAIRQESMILSQVNHSNIVKQLDYCETEENIYMFLEYCKGLTLIHYIQQTQSTQKETLFIIRELLKAIIYLHKKKIVHRDIKLENIIVHCEQKEREEAKITVKLVDFGCSVVLQDGEMISGFCGSIYYVSPETLSGYYTRTCDVWSVGVVAFALLVKRFPFGGLDDDEVAEQILDKKMKIQYTNAEKKAVPMRLRNWLKYMLKRKLKKRVDANQALFLLISQCME